MMRVTKLSRHPAIRRGIAAVLLLSSLPLLESCNSATVGSSVEGSQLDITDKIRSIDLLPRQSQPVGTASATAGSNRASSPRSTKAQR